LETLWGFESDEGSVEACHSVETLHRRINSLPALQVSQYRISWTPGGNVTFADSDARAFNASSLATGVEYTFRVQARNLNRLGFEDGATVTGAAVSTPPKPLSLRLVQFYSDAVELAWSAAGGAPLPLSYEVQCRLADAAPGTVPAAVVAGGCLSGPAGARAPFVPTANVEAPTTSARIERLADGVAYQFRVCAVGVPPPSPY